MLNVVHSMMTAGRSRWWFTLANITQDLFGYICPCVCDIWV
jgi:hypothetical protein